MVVMVVVDPDARRGHVRRTVATMLTARCDRPIPDSVQSERGDGVMQSPLNPRGNNADRHVAADA
jgi:hypothetical protein